uniref:NADH-ubiquinone oxidoreductase chain 2 n=1 Tax=Mayetiola destructor TaxID=39758 RepID=C7FIJ1_MAYDE|nr:NADH dehydrogenase subunit 2 [Mayetiola destructor]
MMKKENNKNLIFKMILILSSLMIFTSNLWLNMWIYLEINLISFIFLLMNYKNYLFLESSLIYFLIQTMASIILLFSLINSIIYLKFKNLMMFAIFLKMGIAPLHYWLIMMVEMLNWIMIYILLTWQKIAPLLLLNLYNNTKMLMIFLLLSMMIGSLMGINYSSLKKIMAYSSINQLSWIIISLMYLNKLFKMYMCIYMYMMFFTIYCFQFFNLTFIYNIYILKIDLYLMMVMFMNLLSLGGLPPFIGFYPKMMIINMLNNSMMMFFMIMFTLITLFYYIRMMQSTMMINMLKMNMIFKLKTNKLNLMIKLSLLSNLMLMMILMIY